MALVNQIETDLVTAMKAKEVLKVGALRMLKAAFGHLAIEKKKNQLDDAEAVDVIRKQVKQRKESMESFEKAGRAELASKERQEMEVLQAYLPKELSDDEIRKFAEQAIAASGAKSKADLGKVMKELMPNVKGKADGQRVNQIVGQLLP